MKRGRLDRNFYNNYRNTLTSTIRRAKNDHFQSSLTAANNDPYKMWKIIGNLTNKNKSFSNIKELNCSNGTTTNDPRLISETFNNHFINSVTALKNDLPDSSNMPSFDNFPSNDQSIFLSPTTSNEVVKIISSFDNKSTSLDDLPFKILKLVAAHIAPILARIYNIMIESGVYPSSLKSARVTPVFKKGDRLNPTNYRPISVLKSINKIFERLLLSRLESFFETHNIITAHQYGFRKNRGTDDAIMDILGSIRNSMLSKRYCIATFFDFSKAFDTLNHERLLVKLYKYGIRGVALDLVKSYLTGRTQSVSLKGRSSATCQLMQGVPQGSILGPWLFNVYVNDLHHFLNHPPTQYADDTTVVVDDPNIDKLFDSLQSDLDVFFQWSVVNCLSLNASKTKFMLFSNRHFVGPMKPLSINNIHLESVTSIKFLGVHIDYKLNFSTHLDKLYHKFSRLVGLTYTIGRKLSLNAAHSFYHALCHSHLRYGIIFWGGTFKTYINKLQSYQDKIMRNLFRDKLDYRNLTNEIYSQTQILKIADIHYLETCVVIYKAKNCNKYAPLQSKLQDLSYNHDHFIRHQNTYKLPNSPTDRLRNDYLFQSVYNWNRLDNVTRISVSINCFKNRIKIKCLSYYV